MNFKKLFCISAIIIVFISAVSLQAQKKPDRRSPLHIAIDSNDVAGAQRAIAQGADVNAVETTEFTPEKDTMLLHAMQKGHREIALLLLKAPGIDVNKTGDGQPTSDWVRTPLIQAASMGDAEIASILLKMGAKVNVRDSGTIPAIMWAKKYPDVVRVLATESKGLDIDMIWPFPETDTLWQSSAEERLETVKVLVEHGAKISFTQVDYGDSMLTTTIGHKKRDVLDYLVAKGADIYHLSKTWNTTLMSAIAGSTGKNAKTNYDFIEYFITNYNKKLDFQATYTALDEAAIVGNLDVINLLLDRGATLELKSLASGGTALHYAVTSRKPEAVRLLIKRKANIEARDAIGDTPLIRAVYNSDPAMVQLLVDLGAAVNIKSLGNVMVTPLVHGATDPNPFNVKNNLAIFDILLKAKADIDLKSGDGTTALMAAARQSNTAQGYELASFFIGKGANLDLKNNKGETALMLAAGAGNEKLVQLLMDKGADAKLKNGAGETVMSYAKRAPSPGSAALLQSQGLQPEAPIVHKTVIVDTLLGTWTGFADGIPQALYTITLNRNGAYSFNSKLTAEAMKYMPKGAIASSTIAAHHGTYTTNDDILIWNPVGTPPTSMQWKLDKGMLILDNRIRLKRAVIKTH